MNPAVCSPCRIGTRRMLEILDKVPKRPGTMEDLDKLEEQQSI